MSIVNRVLFAVIIISMVAKIGSAGAVTKVAPSCLTQQEFEKKYGHEAFQILSQTASPQELLEQPINRIFKDTDLKTELIKDALLEVARPLDDSDVSQIESEIKVIQTIDPYLSAPKFYACTFEVIKNGEELAYFYYIIQEKQNKILSEKLISLRLFGSNPIGQIFTFLQIAFNIQILHSKGYVHQDIRPENIMSTDSYLTDVRLINFSKTVKVGQPGLEGTKYYYSPDKFNKEGFIASFHHDAYAFAITILSLLDFTKAFEKLIEKDCPKTLEIFSIDCQNTFKKSLFVYSIERNLPNSDVKESVLPYDLVKYINNYLFEKDKPLDISDMIAEMIRIYNVLNVGQEEKNADMTEYITEIESIYKFNIDEINKIKASLSGKNILII